VKQLLIVFVHGENNDTGLRVTTFQDSGHLKTAHLRHIDVDQYDIWNKQISLLNRSRAVRRLADDDNVRFIFEAPTNTPAKQRMIVHDQDLNSVQCFSPSIGTQWRRPAKSSGLGP
jgi:hypothetical protein